MTTKYIICADCKKTLARLKGISHDSTISNPHKSLCIECATVRYEKTKSEMRAV